MTRSMLFTMLPLSSRSTTTLDGLGFIRKECHRLRFAVVNDLKILFREIGNQPAGGVRHRGEERNGLRARPEEGRLKLCDHRGSGHNDEDRTAPKMPHISIIGPALRSLPWSSLGLLPAHFSDHGIAKFSKGFRRNVAVTCSAQLTDRQNAVALRQSMRAWEHSFQKRTESLGRLVETYFRKVRKDGLKGPDISAAFCQLGVVNAARRANVKPGVHALRYAFCSHLSMKGHPRGRFKIWPDMRIWRRRSVTCTCLQRPSRARCGYLLDSGKTVATSVATGSVETANSSR